MLKKFCGINKTCACVFTLTVYTLQVVARNDATTRTCVLNFIWYSIIIRTVAGVLSQFFEKGRASSRYIHLFNPTFTFFKNLQERYRFFPLLNDKENFTFRVKALRREAASIKKSNFSLWLQVVYSTQT